MKEYRYTRGWAIAFYLVAPLLIALGGWLLYESYQGVYTIHNTTWFIISLSVAIIAIAVLGGIDIYLSKVIVTDEKIVSISLFQRRELLFHEIAGYTVNPNYIIVKPTKPTLKQLRISVYIEKIDEIVYLIAERYPDLDEVTIENEHNEILSNNKHGLTEEARETKLQTAKRISSVLNWLGGISFVWLWFKPEPYQYAVFFAIIIPLLTIAAVIYYKGLIRINEVNKSAHPFITIGLVFSSVALPLRAILDYNTILQLNTWVYISTLTVILTVILFLKSEITFKEISDYFTLLFFIAIFFGYSYGTILLINCYYDTSRATIYSAVVLEKSESTDKGTEYHVNLSAWSNGETQTEINIDKELYTRIRSGDTILVYRYNGLLATPWFEVSKNN